MVTCLIYSGLSHAHSSIYQCHDCVSSLIRLGSFIYQGIYSLGITRIAPSILIIHGKCSCNPGKHIHISPSSYVSLTVPEPDEPLSLAKWLHSKYKLFRVLGLSLTPLSSDSQVVYFKLSFDIVRHLVLNTSLCQI